MVHKIKIENFDHLLIIRWFNGKVTKIKAPSVHRAFSILKKKKELHGKLITWIIYKDNKKIKQGWK